MANQLQQPLFSREALVRLIGPLIIEQLLLMTVGMADTVRSPRPARPPYQACLWWIISTP